MDVLRALWQTIVKMFAADLWLSVSVIAIVAACGAGLRLELFSNTVAPLLLFGGIVVALAAGILRAAPPKV